MRVMTQEVRGVLGQLLKAVESSGGDGQGAQVAYAAARAKAAAKAAGERQAKRPTGVTGAELRKLEEELWTRALAALPARDGVPSLL